MNIGNIENVRSEALRFAEKHLRTLASEIMKWRENATIPADSKLSELVDICSRIDGLQPVVFAETTVMDVALVRIAWLSDQGIDVERNGSNASSSVQ